MPIARPIFVPDAFIAAFHSGPVREGRVEGRGLALPVAFIATADFESVREMTGGLEDSRAPGAFTAGGETRKVPAPTAFSLLSLEADVRMV